MSEERNERGIDWRIKIIQGIAKVVNYAGLVRGAT